MTRFEPVTLSFTNGLKEKIFRKAQNDKQVGVVFGKVINGDEIAEHEKEYAATTIKNGFLKKKGEKLEIDVPFFPIEEYKWFRELLP